MEWAQKAISLPVSRVSPRPRFDRNHCLLSSTKLTRQMGTFNAVPQSAVMRSNSWWRGVSSLRFGMGGRGRAGAARRFGGVWDEWPGARRGRLSRSSSVDATGAPARRRRGICVERAPPRVARRLRGRRGFRNGTLVSYSSNERSVDMRSSSSSGRGQDMFCSLRALAQLSPSGAAPARLRLRWPRLRYRRGWARVTTFEARQRRPRRRLARFYSGDQAQS